MLREILNLETMQNHIIRLVVYGGMPTELANELHYRSFRYFKEKQHDSIRQISIPLASTKQIHPRTGEDDKGE